MTTFTLKANQAALILEVSQESEVQVEAAFPDESDEAGTLAAEICTVVGQKLATDENFQSEIMKALDQKEEDA